MTASSKSQSISRRRLTNAPPPPSVTIVHDYLTQTGGAERVLLAMTRALPTAEVVTSIYDPDRTFPAFSNLDVRTTMLQHSAILRQNHRLGLPLYAPAFSRIHTTTDITLCSTSGWAHGARASGAKVLYVHNTPRWLYQRDEYLRDQSHVAAGALSLIAPLLRPWDRRAARSADHVVANSEVVRRRIQRYWKMGAEIIHPPHGANPDGAKEPVQGVAPGYLLVVARLLPYKHVDTVVAAMWRLTEDRLVIVGSGPESVRIRQAAPRNCHFLPQVTDAQLTWLYSNCRAVVSAASEDFGLVPIEAMAFGRPAVVLRRGGFLETVEDGATGLFFDRLVAADVSDAVRRLDGIKWEPARLTRQAEQFSEDRFAQQLRATIARVWASRLADLGRRAGHRKGSSVSRAAISGTGGGLE